MYARTRKTERASEESLRLVSDHVRGWRLHDVLAVIEQQGWTLDVSAVITMLRQLIPAVALFSRHQRDAAIGTIAPERLILTPQGRLVIAEYVLAPGLEKMQFTRERLWREFRVAMPHDSPPSRIPPGADVVGIGVVALSLLLGRTLKHDEYLVSLGDLFDTLIESRGGTTSKLSAPFRTWVSRALQFEPHASYSTVQEAQLAFEEMLAKERAYVTTAAELDQFIVNFERIAGPPAMPSSPDTSALTAPIAPVAPIAPGAPNAPNAPHAPHAPHAPSAPVPAPGAAASDEFVPAWRRFALPALVTIVVVQAAVIAWLSSGDAAVLNRGGELTVQSRPAAARVSVDGEERGVTPFQMELSPGSHVVEVRVGRSEPRVIPVVIREGVQTGLYVELQSVATVGGLEVRSEPAKARVSVGGQFRGETPLVLKDLPPGEVEVVVQAGSRQVKQTVRIEPGITSQLVVPLGR
jgi:hypothetical protein